MFRFNPRGENLRALEQNILKYRTFEMVLILFYVEEIKTLVFKTIPVTGDYRKSYSQKNEQPLKRNKKTQKLLWQLLIDEKILTKDEKEDIKSIIDFRNDIAHSIEGSPNLDILFPLYCKHTTNYLFLKQFIILAYNNECGNSNNNFLKKKYEE